MTKNVGLRDANLRTVGAIILILIALFVIDAPYVQIVLAVGAAMLAGTAFLRTCPIYTYLHKDTTNTSTSATTETPPSPRDTVEDGTK